MDIDINKKKITNVINSCSFDVLSDKEKKEGFEEAATHKKTGKKLKFFNLGKKNNWKTLLDPEIEKKIKKVFMQEMKELGYIQMTCKRWSGRREFYPRPKRWQRVPLFNAIVFQRLFLAKYA